MILFDDNEPHKKLVERISRDFVVQTLVRFYEAAELRTKNEIIVTKTGFTQTAEELLTMAKQDQKSPPATVEVLFNRIYAFFVALEYLNICRFTVGSGALRYFKELREFEKERPGFSSALIADQLIRKKVSKLMEEKRSSFKTYSEALLEVLNNHKYLWNDARCQVTLKPRQSGQDSDEKEAGKGTKRKTEEFETPKKSKKAEARAKARARNKALVKEAKAAKKASGASGGAPPAPAPAAVAPAPAAGGGSAAKPAQIPADEFKKITACKYTGDRRCNFYNSSRGCKAGSSCKFKHLCVQCGAGHPMVGNH